MSKELRNTGVVMLGLLRIRYLPNRPNSFGQLCVLFDDDWLFWAECMWRLSRGIPSALE